MTLESRSLGNHMPLNGALVPVFGIALAAVSEKQTSTMVVELPPFLLLRIASFSMPSSK